MHHDKLVRRTSVSDSGSSAEPRNHDPFVIVEYSTTIHFLSGLKVDCKNIAQISAQLSATQLSG